MSHEFIYKEFDKEGLETLKVIEGASHFNAWMYQCVAPFLKGRVLEIGSGIGNISEEVLKHGFSLTMSDIRSNYCEYLKDKFKGRKGIEGIIEFDLVHPDFDVKYASMLGTYDSAFALNVVEHIEDDQLAINNAMKLLRKGGNLIVLVPAYQWLYNNFDKELFHFRRYNRKGVKELFSRAGSQIKSAIYFNAFGIPGWFITGKIFGKKTIPSGQMNFFNSLVPVMKVLDRMTGRNIGLSVVVAGEKMDA